MQKFLSILNKVPLLNGLGEQEILSALGCLEARVVKHAKNEFVCLEGEEAKFVGVVLSGKVEVQKTDYNGNINIISTLYPSDLIAASSCYSTDRRVPFDIRCVADSEILRLNITNIIRPCCNACGFHSRIIENMLKIISDRNMQLTYKIDILTKRSIRERLLAYLTSQSKKAGSNKFSVPLSRRQMADFLSINRSALSRELCTLRDEGVLDFDKNHFVLMLCE